jgi:hypothetical protein
MTARTYGLIAIATLLLAACGTDPGDRTASGAGVGAGTGALVGAAFGGVGVIPGAVIGAAVGGGTGAVTTAQQIDLGTPVWRRGSGGSSHAEADTNEKLSSN